MAKGALPDNQGMKIYLPDDLSDISNLNLDSYENAVVVVNAAATELQKQLQQANCSYEVASSDPEDDSQQDENPPEQEDKNEDENQPEQEDKNEDENPPEQEDKNEDENQTEQEDKNDTENPSGQEGVTWSTVIIDQSVTNNDYSNNMVDNNVVNNTVNINTGKTDADGINAEEANAQQQTSTLQGGDTFTAGKLEYKVLTSETAAFIGVNDKKQTALTIPKQVSVGAQKFKVTEIQEKACYNNKKLKKIVVGNNVTVIQASAFAGCSNVKSISVGTSVKKIGAKAFAGDKKLKKLTIKSKKLSLVGKKALSGVPKTIKIYSPKSKTKVYKKLINKA
jgi:cobalamin biosynthesis protein CobT